MSELQIYHLAPRNLADKFFINVAFLSFFRVLIFLSTSIALCSLVVVRQSQKLFGDKISAESVTIGKSYGHLSVFGIFRVSSLEEQIAKELGVAWAFPILRF